MTAEGLAIGLRDPHPGPLVLTFVRPYADPRAAIARELVGRLADARAALRADVAVRTRYAILLLDDPAGGALPDWLRRGREWEVITGPQSAVRSLAARLGVLVWDGTTDVPGQTFVTVIADAEGTIRDRLIGLDSWNLADLVGTIVGAE